MRRSRLLFLCMFLLVACSPAAQAPTETLLPAATPLPPTVPPTPMPESIANAKELPRWVDELVHAYGATVTVNGSPMDADALVAQIRAQPVLFTQVKQVNGTSISFLVVNGIPIAMRTETKWEEATMAKLSTLAGVTFEFAPRTAENRPFEYSRTLKKVAAAESYFTFPNEMDTCTIFNDFTQDDWSRVITNWESIQRDLDQGKVPDGFPYQWQPAHKLFHYLGQYVPNAQFRGTHLVELRMPAGYCLLAESIVRAKEQQNFD